MAWYAAHTHSGAEARALWHIERQGFSAYLPRYMKQRRHARKTDWIQAPLFPRYLFVWFEVAKQRWQAIQSTIGVRYLICGEQAPLMVPQRLIEELRSREDERGLIDMARQAPFRRGDRVQLTAGALIDQIGVFECCSDDERAVVLLHLLGRDLRVRVAPSSLCVVH